MDFIDEKEQKLQKLEVSNLSSWLVGFDNVILCIGPNIKN